MEIIVPGQEVVIIRADRIEHDENLNLTRFNGRVSLRRGLELLTADQAVWNNQTQTAEVIGSVRLEAPEFTMEAERALVNMELSLAKIYEGRAFFSRNNYYLNGTIIERLSEKKFQVTEASATTCDGQTPPWTIFAKHLTVTENGYASATGVVFKGAGSSIPFFTTPYFIFPVKTERQSGLLQPGLAVSSKSGPMVSLPFFWATGENHDMTFTPVWREKRGLSSTLEGRYHLSWGRGLWQASHLNDQVSRQYKYTNDRGHESTGERFWLRAQNQGRFEEWDVNLNLDLASDPYYLREFTHEADGFEQSSKAFSSTFGHTFKEALNPNRANELYAQKLDGQTQIRAGLHYTQNLYNKGNHDTLQRLPAIQYDLVGHSLGDSLNLRQSPRLSLGTRYDHFYRLTDEKSDLTESGHRVKLQPTVDWNRSLGLANLKLTGGLDMAAYSVAGRRLSPAKAQEAGIRAGHERWYNLLTGSAEAELSTTFSRVFEGGPGQATATRHQISPTLAFNYVDAPDNQGRLPFWDHFDRRLPSRAIRYGLSNNLVAKTSSQPSDQKTEEATDRYFQFLKFGLWSSYELADNSRLTNHQYDRYYDTNYFGQGSGPLETHLEAFFAPHISARLVSSFNTNTGRALSHDLSLNLADDRGDRLSLTYDYDAPEAKSFIPTANSHQEARANLDLKLDSEWSASFFTRFDLKNDKALESMAKLTYQTQCYGLGLIYSKTYSEQSVGLLIDLMGLGSIAFSGTADTPN